MSWIDDVLDALAAESTGGYHAGARAASEPTALGALALTAHNRLDVARANIEWLLKAQGTDGSVGPDQHDFTPGWFTALSILAWTAAAPIIPEFSDRARTAIVRAVAWTLGQRGEPLPRTPELGHDTTLIGWPWVAETHSWVEPTAFHVIALTAAGQGTHARTTEAVRLLVDRLLPDGGCNYGNTSVLGQMLRPHVQPSGLAMLALAPHQPEGPKIAASLDYLAAMVDAEAGTSSACYALMGLAANHRQADAVRVLEPLAKRALARDRSPYKLALIALAALEQNNPLITLPAQRLAADRVKSAPGRNDS